MELYLCYNNLALSHFVFFLQFGSARWSHSAFIKSSTEHENDNLKQVNLVIARMSVCIDADCVIDKARSSFGHDWSFPTQGMEQCSTYHM